MIVYTESPNKSTYAHTQNYYREKSLAKLQDTITICKNHCYFYKLGMRNQNNEIKKISFTIPSKTEHL